MPLSGRMWLLYCERDAPGARGLTMGQPLIHETQGQGRWYPAARDVLARAVDGYLTAAGPQRGDGRLVGLIAPHAGYAYSGSVAGYAYRALRDQAGDDPPPTVVILGFCHRQAFPGVALLGGDGLCSPLGTARLDRAATDWLVETHPIFAWDAEPHAGEHSADNQVPFVQRALPEAALVIGLFGEQRADTVAQVAVALCALARRTRVIVIASTDLLHDPDHERVRRVDGETVRDLVTMDTAALWRRWRPDFQVCCGIGPVQALLTYARAKGVSAGTLLCARNSGDELPKSRDTWVVGYAAMAFSVV